MMRSGLPGLFVAIVSFAIEIGASLLFRRWFIRHFGRKRAFDVALVILTLAGPFGRTLVGLGFDDRLAWIEAVGLIFGLTMILSVPILYFIDASTKKVSPERREAIAKIGGGAVVAAAVVPLARGVFTRFDFEVIEVPIRIAKLPRALDGFSIAQISDIHVGAFLGERELRRAEDAIAALEPDLVAMTGDLVHLRPTYLPLAIDWVRRLGGRARHGVLSILGNHEYYVGRATVLEAYRRAGLPLLINESRSIAGIGFGAVDDSYARARGGEGPNLDAALARLPDDAPRILLAHQPVEFTESAGRVDLQLSGHTHGGQIAPIGPVLVNALYRGRCAGLYRSNGSALYVNRGFGTSGPPSRVAVRPEITKIVLVAG